MTAGHSYLVAMLVSGGPFLLAGGLTPANVATAIRTVKPYAVDVSTGVERDKGIKSREKIEAFMREVRNSEA